MYQARALDIKCIHGSHRHLINHLCLGDPEEPQVMQSLALKEGFIVLQQTDGFFRSTCAR
ncbi:MAG: hypothetical protein ACD_17C00393G0001, partial [uncultured bacterium]